MASTFANYTAQWYVRTGGNELNGGGFDPFVTGAGTNYADADAAIIDSTTGTCTVGSTTWTDSNVTFTSAMVGNVLRISAKTGGTSTALDYFVVTGYTDAHNIALDRSPCATTNITAATYRIGGAFASLKSFASSATGSMGTPTLATPLLAGNRIYIRGSGNSNPSSVDYDFAGGGTWTMPNGTRSAGGNGEIKLIGYNGRPLIGHGGFMISATNWTTKNISFKRTAATSADPALSAASAGGVNSTLFCIYDQNGYDACEYRGEYGHVLFCEFRNGGGGAAGTVAVCQVTHPGSGVIGCYFHGLRGPAIYSGYTALITTFMEIAYNYIVDNLSDGIVMEPSYAPYCYAIFNNTIHNNGGDGIRLKAGWAACVTIFNNIISGHVGSGKYAWNSDDTHQTNRRLKRMFCGYNCFYGNTTNFNQIGGVNTWQLHSTDLTVDPGYADSAAHDFATGDAMEGVGLSGLNGYLGNSPNKVNIGAYQGIPVGIGGPLVGPGHLIDAFGPLIRGRLAA